MPSWNARLRGLDDRVLGQERLGRPTPPWVVPAMVTFMLFLAAFLAITDHVGPAITSLSAVVGLIVGATVVRRSRTKS